MRHLKRIVVTVALTVLAALPALAGDYAKYDVIGFSTDGRYFAFEEYGTQDGSGFPYSHIYVIDTTKNAFATGPVKVRIDRDYATEQRARRDAAARARRMLATYKIVRGNTGSLVVNRLPTDLTVNSSQRDVVRFAEEIGSMYQKGDYDLELREIKTVVKPCDEYGDDTFMIDLSLTDRESKVPRVLQKDSTLPSSRGCALSYDIRSVYTYRDVVVVFLSVFTRGFEGPDMRHIAVSARLR